MFQVLIGILTIVLEEKKEDRQNEVSSPYRYSNNFKINAFTFFNYFVSSPYRYSNNMTEMQQSSAYLMGFKSL